MKIKNEEEKIENEEGQLRQTLKQTLTYQGNHKPPQGILVVLAGSIPSLERQPNKTIAKIEIVRSPKYENISDGLRNKK